MAKIKISLDSACTNYRLLEDGELVEQRKTKCDRNWVLPDGFDEKLDTMMRQTKQVTLASPDTFDLTAKEGEELRLTKDIPKPKSKEERRAELLKELKELDSSDG
jgi:hypothetical protein